MCSEQESGLAYPYPDLKYTWKCEHEVTYPQPEPRNVSKCIHMHCIQHGSVNMRSHAQYWITSIHLFN